MSRRMPLPLLIGLMGWLVLATAPGAPAVTRAKQVWVSLWPEYDRSSMLVIYRITLPEDEQLPARLSLRIPQRAGRPYAVATAPSINDTLVNAQYEYAPATGSPWAWVHVTTPHPYVQVEYYDPALDTQKPQRIYTYEWPGDLEVQEFIVEFLPPWNARQPSTEPALPQQGSGPGGLPVYQKNFGRLQTGQTLTLTLAYTKPDATLTVEHLQTGATVSQSMPAEAPTTSPRSAFPAWKTWLPWVLVGLGLLLVGGGAWLWWKERGELRSSHGRGNIRRGEEIHIRFCPSCGTETLPGARYCHRCGAPLYKP